MNNSQTGLEILHPDRLPGGRVQAAIFDFDGTFSTLRCGWEEVMRPMMLEYIGGGQADDALRRRVDEYIDQSTASRRSIRCAGSPSRLTQPMAAIPAVTNGV